MNKKSSILAFLLLGAITTYADTQVTLPTVYVTAAKYQQSATDNTKVVESITGETLRTLGVISVQEALSLFSNIHVVNASGVQSVFMQGVGSNQVKILLDGVTLKDPTTPQGTPLINHIDIDYIDRIEIVSGGQSTLYGSGAMAGVINILTKKNTEKNILLQTAIKGPHDRAGFSYGQDIAGYLFSLSAKLDNDRSHSAIQGLAEKDEVKAHSLQVALNKELPIGNLDLTYRQHRVEEGLDYNNNFSPLYDDPNNTSTTQQNTTFAKWSLPWKDNTTNLIFTASYTSRHAINLADSGSSSFSDDMHTGQTRSIDFQNIFKLETDHTILIGLEHSHENGSFKSNYNGFTDTLTNKNLDTLSTYSQWEWRNPMVTSVIGGRYESFGNKHVNTYDLSFSKEIIPSVITKYNASSGHREPSLYEAYAQDAYTINNPNLTAENSYSRQYSISHAINNFEYGATIFEQDVYNKITYVTINPTLFTSSYKNIAGKTKSRGTNYHIKAFQLPYLSYLLLGYTHTHSKNTDGTPTLRIPKNELSLSAVIPIGKLTTGITLKYRGEIQDTTTKKAKEYTVIDTHMTYKLTSTLQANITVYNLQDNKYFPLNNYQVSGREILAGVTYSF
ncbi:MAG: TonB-dependent receptor [Candidatus Margulisbacteria bacterium]|nr:TonB-dependent receptor [Candidatus Margulisiibacteriota bacterium]